MASAGADPSGVALSQNSGVNVYTHAIERPKQTIGSTNTAGQTTSLEDVWKAVEEIQESQRQRKSVQNVGRVEPFLKRLEQYSKIIEATCNGTPYLPWIWGPIKLMLQLPDEDRASFDKLFAVYKRIGDAMPEFDRFQAALGHRPDVQANLTHIFVQIMEFHRSVYKFYPRRSWIILFDALSKSFENEFNDIVKILSDQKQLLDHEIHLADLEAQQEKKTEIIKMLRDATLSQPPGLNTVATLYKPLSLEKAEIRLLTFTSPQTETASQYSLIAVPLPKSPPYIALSYTWGDPTDTVPITINNFEIQITVNLKAALLRLWAEGVGRMGTIFRRALEVAVWLGSEQRIMEQALSGADEPRNLGEESRLSILPIRKELLSQPYWKRVWITQEIAVASRISVYCGDYRIGWDHFVEMCQFRAGGKALTTESQPEDETISGFTTLLRLRKDTLARQPIRFLDALHQSRSSLSTDPRDKLYALLGLTFDGRHFIPEPNYINSVAESFTDFTTAIIEGGELLDFIYLRSATRKNDGQLPSWVPDWTDLDNPVARRQLDYIMDRLPSHSENPEANNVRKRAEIDSSRSELAVNGVLFDTVDGVGSAFPTNNRDVAAYTSTMPDEAQPGTSSAASHLVCQLIDGMGLFPEIESAKRRKHQATDPLLVDFLWNGVWREGTVECCIKDRSFIGGHIISSKRQIYSTRFFLEEDLASDFLFRHDAYDDLLDAENTAYLEEIQGLRGAKVSKYKQELEQSLMNDIPQRLFPQFIVWLSENYSFMMDGRRIKSWSKTWGLEISQTAEAGPAFRHLFKFMQLGMRRLRTEKDLLG